jgi:hypothetical protein
VIFDKGTLTGGHLSLNAPTACGDALIAFLGVLGIIFIRLLHCRFSDRPAQGGDIILYGEAQHHLFDSFVIPACSRHLGSDVGLLVCVVLFPMD